MHCGLCQELCNHYVTIKTMKKGRESNTNSPSQLLLLIVLYLLPHKDHPGRQGFHYHCLHYLRENARTILIQTVQNG